MISVPTDISGCNLWVAHPTDEFTDTGTARATDAQAVEQWNDQSGAGNHLVQTTSGQRMVVDNYYGSLVSEVGSGQGMALPAGYPINNHSFSIFFICDLNALREVYLNGPGLKPYGYLLEATSDICNLFIDGATGLLNFHSAGGTQVSTAIPPTSRSLIGMVCGASGVTIYVNGTSYSLTAASSASATGGTIFMDDTANYPCQAGIVETFAYNVAVTGGNLTDILAYAKTKGVATGQATNVVFDGDSITQGYGSTQNKGWVKQIGINNCLQYNLGEASALLTTLTSQAATRIDPLIQGGTLNILCIFAGTNDIDFGGSSGATTYANLQSYCSARRTAGWDKIVVFTMLPRTGDETQRVIYNNAITAGFAAHTIDCDAVADVGGDATIGQAGQNTNATYYLDSIHPTTAGYAIIAGYARTELLTFLNQTAQPVASPTPGTFVSSQAVTLTCETDISTIYYTLDGTDPVIP